MTRNTLKLALAGAVAASLVQSAAFVSGAFAQGPPPPIGGPARGFMRADADGDGVVTRAEAVAEAERRFDAMDLNHDGRVDATEAPRGPRRGPRGPEDAPPPPPPAPNPQ